MQCCIGCNKAQLVNSLGHVAWRWIRWCPVEFFDFHGAITHFTIKESEVVSPQSPLKKHALQFSLGLADPKKKVCKLLKKKDSKQDVQELISAADNLHLGLSCGKPSSSLPFHYICIACMSIPRQILNIFALPNKLLLIVLPTRKFCII
jgi:hypothetical protein